jgi:hypothetical protein
LQLLLPLLGQVAMLLALLQQGLLRLLPDTTSCAILADSTAYCLTPAPRRQHMLNSA